MTAPAAMRAPAAALLPHDAYGRAVVEAVWQAGLRPDDCVVQENRDSGELEILIALGEDAYDPAVCEHAWPHGVRVCWSHLDGWEYAEVGQDGVAGTWHELISAVLPPPCAVAAPIALLAAGRVVELPVRWCGEDDSAAGIAPPEGELQLLAATEEAVRSWTARRGYVWCLP